MSVLKTYKKAVKNQSIIPVENQVQKQSDLTKTFGKTNFDVENPAPLGGPEPKPYEISKANSPLLSTFGKTSLDLENPTPVGGPNRTTAANIPAGTYQVTTDQGPLLYNKNNLQGQSTGQIVNKELNQYTPTSTYLEKITPYKNNNN
jgi:hypothetical protein|tara:strand:- start:10647 stop:11087 length:441 start_codon:yes stop_codon:yes gene_type:complete